MGMVRWAGYYFFLFFLFETWPRVYFSLLPLWTLDVHSVLQFISFLPSFNYRLIRVIDCNSSGRVDNHLKLTTSNFMPQYTTGK